MRKAALVTRWIVRLAGLVQIVLGLMFWSGRGLSLIPVHMLIGLIVAWGLLVIAVLASRTGTRASVVVLAVVWAFMLPAFGVAHVGMLPGEWHWVVRVLHLAIGLGALGFADRLAEQVLRGVARRRSAASGAGTEDRRVTASRRAS